MSYHITLKKDIDYLVKDNKVELIDKYTGRVLEGRKLQDNLHECLEIKENLKLNKENISTDSISIQTFINLFKQKCGMSGTVITSKEEFNSIYNLEVVKIQPHQKNIREDYGIKVFDTKEEKWQYISNLTNKIFIPILIATGSVSDSELVANKLDRKYQIVNAKTQEEEIKAVENAGKLNTLTVSTNMMGRGTDIILDKDAEKMGGLFVISTEAATSRRVDNQLRGRAGRQGQRGKFLQVVSLEDDLFRNLPEEFESLIKRVKSSPKKTISRIQKYYESMSCQSRESLFKYSIIQYKYKKQLYDFREEVLRYKITKPIVISELYEKYEKDWLDKNIIEKEFESVEDILIHRECDNRNLLILINEGIRTFNFSSEEIRDSIGYAGLIGKKPEEEYLREMDALYLKVIEGIKLKWVFT